MVISAKNAAKAVLLDGLSDLEQAALARKYESKTGRAFGCEPCAVARAHTKANAEPPSEVIAIVDDGRRNNAAVRGLLRGIYRG
jgi:hypothetical protein